MHEIRGYLVICPKQYFNSTLAFIFDGRLKITTSTSVRRAKHPNAGQNIQHSIYIFKFLILVPVMGIVGEVLLRILWGRWRLWHWKGVFVEIVSELGLVFEVGIGIELEVEVEWRLLFGDFLRLTFIVVFVNYFCLQNLNFLNFGKKFFLTILRSMCLEFYASNYLPKMSMMAYYTVN